MAATECLSNLRAVSIPDIAAGNQKKPYRELWRGAVYNHERGIAAWQDANDRGESSATWFGRWRGVDGKPDVWLFWVTMYSDAGATSLVFPAEPSELSPPARASILTSSLDKAIARLAEVSK